VSEAHQVMHSQRYTTPGGLRAICKQSAMALETSPPDAGKKSVSSRSPPSQTNEAWKMQESAS